MTSDKAEIIESICSEIRSKYNLNEAQKLELSLKAENEKLINKKAKEKGISPKIINLILFTE
jgi:uncharacterized protein YbaP (TraB family)